MRATIELAQAPTRLDLRQLADQYEATMKVLFEGENRLRAMVQERDEHSSQPEPIDPAWITSMRESLVAMQKEMDVAIAGHPAYEWAMGVPGINRTVACRVIGLIPMFAETDFVTFSKLRKFAGYCPGFDRRIKGQKIAFNSRLRIALHVAWDLIAKSAATVSEKHRPARMYTEIYQSWRRIYAERHGCGVLGKAMADRLGVIGVVDYKSHIENNGKKLPEWPDLRQHLSARRKAMVVFLCHLWEVWRTANGWSTRSLYVHEVLGHTTRYEPADFSSPMMARSKMKAKEVV